MDKSIETSLKYLQILSHNLSLETIDASKLKRLQRVAVRARRSVEAALRHACDERARENVNLSVLKAAVLDEMIDR